MKTATETIKNLNIPFSALRLISRYPREKKIIVEISLPALMKVNQPKTLDDFIKQSKIDFALGEYQTFSSPEALIVDLQS